MKHTTEIKEITHKFEMNGDEVERLATICSYFLKEGSKSGLLIPIPQANLAKEIISLVQPKEKLEMIHTETLNVIDNAKVEKDLGIITILTSRASELLNGRHIYIGVNDLVDCEESIPIDFELNVIVGMQNQLGIKIKDNSNFIFFNEKCATLIMNFMETKGKGRYCGYAATNTGDCLELNLYVDNKGNTSYGVNNYSSKSLRLRYYNDNSFGITKDGSVEISLNAEQANIINSFISRHF